MRNARRWAGAFALAAAMATAGCPGARAQSSVNAPPPSAAKVSGSDMAGDPRGAIRSMSETASKHQDPRKVKIPPLGGGHVSVGGVPAGTVTR